MQAVTVDGVVKRYGSLTAVDGISLSVGEGEVFGILGPNGAGKTTTLEIVEGLREADAGVVRIFDLDVALEAEKIRHLVGVQLQSTALIDSLKVSEMLALFARLHRRSRDPARSLARWRSRSGGMPELTSSPVASDSG